MNEYLIVVASQNPVKLQAVERGFYRMFPDAVFKVDGIDVPSGVSKQPMTDAETRQGALNRVRGAMRAAPKADFWVGVEGGLEDNQAELEAFAWIVILDRSRCGVSRSASFQLPHAISRLVRQGIELGDADDIVFGRSNSKQANGAVGILTGDVVDRVALYEQPVILALTPFKNPGLYPMRAGDPDLTNDTACSGFQTGMSLPGEASA